MLESGSSFVGIAPRVFEELSQELEKSEDETSMKKTALFLSDTATG